MSGITKYKATLYNECVIDTTTNTAIFPHSSKWKEFEEWKKENKMKFYLMMEEKTKINNFNGGLPHIKPNGETLYNEDGELISSKVMVDGGYIYKEYHYTGDLKLESKVEDNELVYEKEFNINEKLPFREIVIDEFATKIESLYHHTDVLRKRVITIPSLGTKTTSFFSEKGKLHKRIQLTKKIKRTSTYFIESGNLESETELDLNTKISTLEEYFTNGKIRTKGTFDKNDKMHGRWEWYALHANEGQVESIHNFEHGNLIGGSKLFMEDGGLFFETKKD